MVLFVTWLEPLLQRELRRQNIVFSAQTLILAGYKNSAIDIPEKFRKANTTLLAGGATGDKEGQIKVVNPRMLGRVRKLTVSLGIISA